MCYLLFPLHIVIKTLRIGYINYCLM